MPLTCRWFLTLTRSGDILSPKKGERRKSRPPFGSPAVSKFIVTTALRSKSHFLPFLHQLPKRSTKHPEELPMRIFSTLTKAGLLAASLMLSTAIAPLAFADDTVMVGGAAMYPTKNIVQNAVNSKDHTTLVAAVKAAGLVPTLSSAGPFTVFAPVNAAFDMLPKGTVKTLLKPKNKGKLTGILTYHVVAGRLSADDIAAKAKAMGGKVELKTVEGDIITLMSDGKGGWNVMDSSGGTAHITIANVFQSNGVIHVIDHVLLPKS